jgi:Glycosyl transferases, related to UDP-glucuronosyltransferase
MHRAPPKNVSLRRHVPQLKVLAQADAFISHGGMGSTMEAMYYGVPLVVIPQMSEQRINATQVQELNLGRCVPSADATASEMRRVFMSVVGDKALKSRVEEMQREVQGAGGAQAAADVVERALNDYSLLS